MWWNRVPKKYQYLDIPFGMWKMYKDEILTGGWKKHKKNRKDRAMIIKREEVK